MNITQQPVVMRTITGAERLDPIRVITVNLKPGQGRIDISCYGRAWTAYWGAMGEQTIEEFFMDCNPDYLLGNLVSGLPAIGRRDQVRDEVYLTRIIVAVQQALRQEAAEAAA